MKTVTADPAAWYLTCPECGHEMEAPCGSLMWTHESIQASPQDDED